MPTSGPDLDFDNSFLRELPADSDASAGSRQVFGAAYSRVQPTPVSDPKLVAASPEVAELLGLDPATSDFAQIFAGNTQLPGMAPYAMCYGGHQFGHWAGQLGDGRAISLGEVVVPDGRFEVQLKGAGPTPYSRRADGRAVLRSSIREFLCSEAMHHLGIPTTRALSLVTTGDSVVRDMFYDGNARAEPGAVVCRVAPSFIRFGTFELPASRRDTKLLRALADHTIRRHYPQLGDPSPAVYPKLLEAIGYRTATMITHWMRVGFVHGVMNTDNMSVLGATIDYGPYGWLDGYDPTWTPNTSDAGQGRYRFGNQPGVALWNMARLAESLLPLVEGPADLQAALDTFAPDFDTKQKAMMASKLGLSGFRAGDAQLFEDLFEALQCVETDMTLFYRRLADLETDPGAARGLSDAALMAPLIEAYYAPDAVTGALEAQIAGWLRRYVERLAQQPTETGERRARMNAINPLYVLRNYLAQEAIEASEGGDHSRVHTLQKIMRSPYTTQAGAENYAKKRPEWARNRAGCSALSCSS